MRSQASIPAQNSATAELVVTPLGAARDAFISQLHHALNLAGESKSKLTREQVRGVVDSIESHLDEYLKHLFGSREADTR